MTSLPASHVVPNTHPASLTAPFPVTLRVGAVAGLVSAAILLLGVLKVAGVVPTATLTQLLAPAGQGLAIFFVLALGGLALTQQQRLAPLMTTLNALALAAGVGVEFVLNLVLRELPAAIRTDVLAGPLAPALTIASVLLLIGSVGFCVLLWRARIAPRALTVGYALCATVVSLRPFVPEWLFLGALAALALCILCLSVWMLTTQRRR